MFASNQALPTGDLPQNGFKSMWTVLALKKSWEVNTKAHKTALLAKICLTHPKYVVFFSSIYFIRHHDKRVCV